MSPIRPIPLKSDAPPKPQNRPRKRFRRPRGCVAVKACQFVGTKPCPVRGCNVARGRQGNGPVANPLAVYGARIVMVVPPPAPGPKS